MTKKYSTKKALVASALSLVLCFSMLLGTTFAWFTDSVTSANNIIKSGNLDVVLEYKTDWDDEWAIVDENTKIFNEDALYEPGYTEVVFLRVSNAGSLALKYNLKVNINSETPSTNVYGDEFKLSDYLKMGTYTQDEYNYGFNYADILMPTMFGDRATALSNVKALTTLAAFDGVVSADAPVLSGETTAQVSVLVLTMPETVGNEANYDKAFDAPEINLGVTLLATQYTAENDSFGNQYDAGATYLQNVSNYVNVPANATAPITLATTRASVTVPASVLNALPDGITSIALAYNSPKMDTANKTVDFSAVELVDQNGKVIDMSMLSITENMETKLLVNDVFADGDTASVYHDGKAVANATVENGYISYEAAHFCKVTVIDSASEYDYIAYNLDTLTAALANGGRVLLMNDIQAKAIIPVEPGSEVYLNMNGKKITVDQNTASNTLLYVKDGAKLVVDGNGTIDLEGVSTMAIFAPYGELVIENGTFIRNKITTVTNKTTGLFMGAKSTSSVVTINGGYFDAGYYDENAADIEAILKGEKALTETADDIAKRNTSKDANSMRVALKDNVSVVLNHSGYGTFTVYGGTFVGMNPAWGDEGCMLPTTPNYLRPWSYYQGTFLAGQTFNADGVVLPDGYTITVSDNGAGVPVYTVAYSK